jgi:hypothetical protein
MTKIYTLEPSFVEYIPDRIDEGTLYISIPFATATHKCCCGCGHDVVTPLSPTDWSLTFDGVSVSLDPSIGNWSFPCQSHYWIKKNSVRWARKWTGDEIRRGRMQDQAIKSEYYNEHQRGGDAPVTDRRQPTTNQPGWLRRLWRRLLRHRLR